MAETDVYKVSILAKDSIHCGLHLVPYIARTVLDTLPASTYVLITDTNIARLHLDAFQKEFKEEFTRLGRPLRFLTHAIPPGETSKSRDGKAAIEDFLLLNRCTRDTVILALGGGVIGDLVGFVAATLCVLFSSFRFSLSSSSAHSGTAACAACVSCRSRRLSSQWSTRAWAERPRSTRRTERTSSARSGSPSTSSSTLPSSRPSPRANFRMAWPRSSRYVRFRMSCKIQKLPWDRLSPHFALFSKRPLRSGMSPTLPHSSRDRRRSSPPSRHPASTTRGAPRRRAPPRRSCSSPSSSARSPSKRI